MHPRRTVDQTIWSVHGDQRALPAKVCVMWTDMVFSSTAALFLAMTVTSLVHQRWARRLPTLGTLTATRRLDGSNIGLVRCSVVVAARDEEARLEGTVRHLLAQHDVAVDVIVVDVTLRQRGVRWRGTFYPLDTLRKGTVR